MPPRPRHSMISNCGKNFAMASGAGALGRGETGLARGEPVSPATSVWVAMFIAIRQRGHNPVGELGGSDVPHCGQTGFDSVLIPVTYRSAEDCYTSSAPGENPGQVAQFRVKVRVIGQGLGDFLPVELAKALPHSVNGHAGRALAEVEPARQRTVINRLVRGHQKAFEGGEIAGVARGCN